MCLYVEKDFAFYFPAYLGLFHYRKGLILFSTLSENSSVKHLFIMESPHGTTWGLSWGLDPSFGEAQQ